MTTAPTCGGRPVDTVVAVPTAPHQDDGAARASGRGVGWWAPLVLLALLSIPLVVAVSVASEPRWYLSGDLSQTEVRVRDVWTANPPLVGLPGRLGGDGEEQGSHPGPVSFWSLSLVHRLLGMSSFALQASAAALNIVAMGLTLWLARRRGGVGVLLGTAVVLVALASAYGVRALIVPWNPYLPILWWVVALMGVWSLLDGDLPAFPVTVFAASYCMQTHISYIGLGGASIGLGALAVAYRLFERRRDRRERRRALWWAFAGTAVAAAVWFPPLAEQATGSQGGNLGTLFEYFTDVQEEPIGLGRGWSLMVANLDPWRLFSRPAIEGRDFLGGPTLAGTWLLAGWLVAALASWRLRHRTLTRLHSLIAVVLAVGVFSVGRIVGPPWAYLALWAWAHCALLVLAVVWTFCATLGKVVPAGARPQAATAGALVGCVVLLGVTARFTVAAAYVEPQEREFSVSVDAITRPTVDALTEGSLPGTGEGSRYLVSWSDPTYWNGRGFALFNELDREGLDVGATSFYAVLVTRHRVVDDGGADAHVRVSVGADIDQWENRPGYEQVAAYDADGSREGGEFAELREAIVAGLRDEGKAELVDRFLDDPEAFPEGGGLSDLVTRQVRRLKAIGEPIAVFVGPVPSE